MIVQVEPINATTSQGVWTRSHECGAYGNICKHFVWFYFFSNHFETGTKFQFWNLQLGDLLRADPTWSWVPTRPLWCFGTLYLKKIHLFGAVENETWKFFTQAIIISPPPPYKIIIIRCCWRWTRGGCQVLWSLESTGGDDYIIFRLLRSLFFLQRWSRSLLFKNDQGASCSKMMKEVTK